MPPKRKTPAAAAAKPSAPKKKVAAREPEPPTEDSSSDVSDVPELFSRFVCFENVSDWQPYEQYVLRTMRPDQTIRAVWDKDDDIIVEYASIHIAKEALRTAVPWCSRIYSTVRPPKDDGWNVGVPEEIMLVRPRLPHRDGQGIRDCVATWADMCFHFQDTHDALPNQQSCGVTLSINSRTVVFNTPEHLRRLAAVANEMATILENVTKEDFGEQIHTDRLQLIDTLDHAWDSATSKLNVSKVLSMNLSYDHS